MPRLEAGHVGDASRRERRGHKIGGGLWCKDGWRMVKKRAVQDLRTQIGLVSSCNRDFAVETQH